MSQQPSQLGDKEGGASQPNIIANAEDPPSGFEQMSLNAPPFEADAFKDINTEVKRTKRNRRAPQDF